MARPTEWRRTTTSFADPGNSVQHNSRSVAVFAGETVGRIHLHYQWVTFPAVPFAPWGVEGVLGVRLQNNLATTPDLLLPDDISDESWMWVEGVGWRGEFGSMDLATNQPVELISAPADGGYRDIQAMRKVLADGAIWVQDGAVLDPPSNQGNHFLSFTISVLVILP